MEGWPDSPPSFAKAFLDCVDRGGGLFTVVLEATMPSIPFLIDMLTVSLSISSEESGDNFTKIGFVDSFRSFKPVHDLRIDSK